MMQSAKFYGAAGLILNQKIDYIYLSASWSHGVDDIFHRYHSAISHIHPLEFNLPRHLVTNESIKKYSGMDALEVHVVGSPFVYTDPSYKNHHGTKYQRAYMPTHSLAGLSFAGEYQKWLETAIKNKCDCIILANSDFSPFTKALKEKIPYNIEIIRGAKVNEENTLHNLKNLFYSIKECVFDLPGSQVVYSVICGVTPIFIEKEISISERAVLLSRLVNQYPKKIRPDIEKHMHSRLGSEEFYKIWSSYNMSELKDLSNFSAGMHCKKDKNLIGKLLLPKTLKENINNGRILLSSKINYKFSNYFK